MIINTDDLRAIQCCHICRKRSGTRSPFAFFNIDLCDLCLAKVVEFVAWNCANTFHDRRIRSDAPFKTLDSEIWALTIENEIRYPIISPFIEDRLKKKSNT